MNNKEDMLIFVNSNNNNNKFYHMKLENNNLSITYGRVGTNGVTINKHPNDYYKIKKSKLAKGYIESEITTENKNTIDKTSLYDLCSSQIKYSNKEIEQLIKKLVDKNIHNIISNTNITYDKKNNIFTTPLGIVTNTGLIKANNILSQIKREINKSNIALENNNDFIELNEEYFKIIPKKIKNLRDIKSYMLIDNNKIEEQLNILDSLKQSLELGNQLKIDKNKVKEDIFQIKLGIVGTNTQIFKKINEKFEDSKNNLHGNYINKAKISKIYKININDEEKNFRTDLNNKWELWHGTKISNLLSIFKSGLLMPSNTPGERTGAMFGNGLYFSDQSTKALNYCDGMFWNNNNKEDTLYLFLADIAMGNYKIPTNPTSLNPPKGFDSYFAKAKISKVRNNEMIIFNKNQIKLKYLIEIKI